MPNNLNSFPVPEEDLRREEVEEEIHRDEDVSIKVTQSPGFLCHIEATAAIRLPARTLYKQVITHPDNAAIFSHMDRCSYRRVLSEPSAVVGAQRQRQQAQQQQQRRVAVAHEASWRFLLFSGKFTTRLLVEEDDASLTMSFQLDDSPPPEGIRMGHGVMKRFHGHWHIRPHPSDPDHASLSTLDQDLALGITLPSAFDGILKSISCNQVKKIFEDVKREASKMNAGNPTLCPWDEATQEI